MRIPNHIGVIPDGNRRWATGKGLPKEKGYNSGLAPGLELYRALPGGGCKRIDFLRVYSRQHKKALPAGESLLKGLRGCRGPSLQGGMLSSWSSVTPNLLCFLKSWLLSQKEGCSEREE